jgi:surface carbohydrate biosynthesis protein
MKIKILLDHVSRELNFAVKLKGYVESTGLGSVAINHQDYINSAKHYDFLDVTFDGKYDILIVPSYNVKRSPEMLFRAWAAGSKLVIYHSEQIFNDQFEEEKLNLSSLDKYKKHVSAHLVWGDEFADKLIQKANVDASEIFIVGNYKFDFLLSVKPSYSKKILFVSDFKIGDLNNEKFELFERSYKVKLPKNYNEICRRGRERSLEWIFRLAKSYPNLEFCLRPHPGEQRELYSTLSEKCHNIYISEPLTSYAEDLISSALVLGFTSTSVMEVITANKLMLSMKVEEIDTNFLSSHKDLLLWRSFKEIKSHVDKINNGEILVPPNELNEKLNRIIARQDDVCANVVLACKSIYEDSNLATRYEISDLINIIKIFITGVVKFVTLRISNILPNAPILNRIVSRSKESFLKRCNEGENLTKALIVSEVKKINDESALILPEIIQTPYGRAFKRKE